MHLAGVTERGLAAPTTRKTPMMIRIASPAITVDASATSLEPLTTIQGRVGMAPILFNLVSEETALLEGYLNATRALGPGKLIAASKTDTDRRLRSTNAKASAVPMAPALSTIIPA